MQDQDFNRVAPDEFGRQAEHSLSGNEFLQLMPLVNRETEPAKTVSSSRVLKMVGA